MWYLLLLGRNGRRLNYEVSCHASRTFRLTFVLAKEWNTFQQIVRVWSELKGAISLVWCRKKWHFVTNVHSYSWLLKFRSLDSSMCRPSIKTQCIFFGLKRGRVFKAASTNLSVVNFAFLRNPSTFFSAQYQWKLCLKKNIKNSSLLFSSN